MLVLFVVVVDSSENVHCNLTKLDSKMCQYIPILYAKSEDNQMTCLCVKKLLYIIVRKMKPILKAYLYIYILRMPGTI